MAKIFDDQGELNLNTLIQVLQKTELEILKAIEEGAPTVIARKKILLKQIQDILAKSYGQIGIYIEKYNKKIEKYSIAEVRQVGVGVLSFDQIDITSALQTMRSVGLIQSTGKKEIKSAFAKTNSYIEKQLNLMTKQIQRGVGKEIASGQILGQSRQKINKKVIELFKKEGIVGFEYKTESGIKKRIQLKSYTEATVRSTLLRTKGMTVAEQALKYGHDLLKVSTHAKASKMCKPFQGVITSITGKTPGFVKLSDILFEGQYITGGGIYHRYCKHSLTVYIESSIVFD